MYSAMSNAEEAGYSAFEEMIIPLESGTFSVPNFLISRKTSNIIIPTEGKEYDI